MCPTLPSFVTKDPISAESSSHNTVLIETDIFVGVSSPRCAAYQHTRLAIKKPDLAAARRSRSMQAGRGGRKGRGTSETTTARSVVRMWADTEGHV